MHRFITVVVVLLIASAADVRAQATQPSFVLCMADDQGFGDVHYNGEAKLQTPVLDEMARTGLRLDRFYAAAPVCSPTRGSFLTGRHPNRFGCFKWGHTLRPQELTLAEALKGAGYRTGHFGKWHLGSVRAQSPVSPGNSGFDTWVSAPNYIDNDPLLSHGGTVKRHAGESSMICVDEALKFIREASHNREPFCAVIWFGSPHNPHRGTDELMKLYEGQGLDVKQQAYFAEITGIDRAMGKLRQQLREMKLADRTLLLYTSDNGPQGPDAKRPGSAGVFRGRKAQLLEGGIRVPAIIEWPAVITAPRPSDAPCNSSDVYPTVLELAGVEVSDQVRPLDGVSLASLIRTGTFGRRQPMGFWDYPARGVRSPSEQLLEEQQLGMPSTIYDDTALSRITRQYDANDRSGDAAWIDGDWKLLRRAQPNDAPPTVELFNVVDDPAERHDRAAEHPDRVERMQQALEHWQASVIHSLNGGDYGQ
ncbi:MAG TPA: sulfatase-like hydrolase/transferase [Tepidisphaeraceae bacterium]|nr:sulfatase-like hydrolase/transferase [Tepidisphaeraceae bacterium]